MLNIGMTELLVFGIITLLILGPDKLPEGARFAGKWYGKIKRMITNVQNDLDRELRLSELQQQMQSELERIKKIEANMQQQAHQFQQSLVIHEDMQNEIQLNKNTIQPVTERRYFKSTHSPYYPVQMPSLSSKVYIKQYQDKASNANHELSNHFKVAV